MSIWIRAVCTPRVQLDEAGLQSAIAKRLKWLTYLFCPEEEEEPDDVLARLRVEKYEGSRGPIFNLHYRTDTGFISCDSYLDADAQEEVEELREFIEERQGPDAEKVRAVLSKAVQTVGFELKASDARSMGWPLAIAAAAWIAEEGAGLLQADGQGWMAPSGSEVEMLLGEE